ncbi:MAG: hypothetical protein HON77_16630 [Gammaproteobacteria bacterium]|jgi:hypothetical protein|nr:hypothetical protein [Gammaproteobacteria bacterium]
MAILSVYGEFGGEINGECEKIGGCYSDCLLRAYRYFPYPEALMSISYAACSIIFNRRRIVDSGIPKASIASVVDGGNYSRIRRFFSLIFSN